MNKEYKRSLGILILGIVGTLFLITGIILIILYFTEGYKTFTFVDDANNNLVGDVSVEWYNILSVAITLLVVSILISLVASLIIFTSNFTNNVEEMKILMGILTLMIIGPIVAIVFGAIAMNKLKSKTPSSKNKKPVETLKPII